MRHRASPEFIRSRNCVSDCVHYRESAGTEPVVLKVAQQTGSSYSATKDKEKVQRQSNTAELMGDPTSDGNTLRSWQPSPLVVTCFAIVIRYMVSLWPYSGQAQQPMYGDYEAQRHWMEITTSLPLHQWYRFDLEYWGLDYPPLTAYVSWVCGKLSGMIEPESMVLGLSRGYETPSHKVFMRLTVIMLDLVVFYWAAKALTHRLTSSQKTGGSSRDWSAASSRMYAIVLLHPSLIIIDHGHFQYNSVCLGLAVAGAAAITNGRYRGAFLGSFLFCLSLNFKQMALYYSPAFFFWLLAWSIWGCRTAVGGRSETPLYAWFGGVVSRVLGLGVVVILSFSTLWAPFCIYSGGESCLSSLKQVLLRLFPFSRGLFEDKVANIWFCLDVFLKLRQKVATPFLTKLALIATLSLLVPVAVELLRPRRALTARRLLLAMFNSSMAFFLCSFQVHEKSILLPLCPLAFLWPDSPLFVTWLQVLGVFSMLPLLGREGLLVPSAVCTMVYVVASMIFVSTNSGPRPECTAFPYGRYVTKGRFNVFVASSVVGMALLLALEAAFLPPDTLPHLYAVLNALFSGANLTVAYVLGVYWQWQHRVDKHEKLQ